MVTTCRAYITDGGLSRVWEQNTSTVIGKIKVCILVFYYLPVKLVDYLLICTRKSISICIKYVTSLYCFYFMMFWVFFHFLSSTKWHLLVLEWPHLYQGDLSLTLELVSSPYVWPRNFVILHNPHSSLLRVSDTVPSPSAMGNLMFEQTPNFLQ